MTEDSPIAQHMRSDTAFLHNRIGWIIRPFMNILLPARAGALQRVCMLCHSAWQDDVLRTQAAQVMSWKQVDHGIVATSEKRVPLRKLQEAITSIKELTLSRPVESLDLHSIPFATALCATFTKRAAAKAGLWWTCDINSDGKFQPDMNVTFSCFRMNQKWERLQLHILRENHPDSTPNRMSYNDQESCCKACKSDISEVISDKMKRRKLAAAVCQRCSNSSSLERVVLYSVHDC